MNSLIDYCEDRMIGIREFILAPEILATFANDYNYYKNSVFTEKSDVYAWAGIKAFRLRFVFRVHFIRDQLRNIR